MDSFYITGKTAVVLGASSEVSRATGCALAIARANVVAVDRDMSIFKPMEKELKTDGYQVECIETDIGSGKNVGPVIDSIYKSYGSIDILVNNLGSLYKPNASGDLDIDDEQWETVVSRGLKNTFAAIKAVVPHMLEAGKGKIVNIASFTGRLGFDFNGLDYCVLNAGLTSMVRQLALQYADSGININAIAPGPVEGSDSACYSSEELALILQKTPLKRLCRPEEVAAAVIYLASNKSDYVIGETMNINGGLYMV